MQEQACGVLESRWCTVRGLKLHYMQSIHPQPATDIPVVMVHGLAVSGRYMVPTAERLAVYHHVSTPDLLGWGKSHNPKHVLTLAELADILVEWMDAIHLSSAIFIGNSLGCQIIARLSVKHPERVREAILVGPTMDPAARTARQAVVNWLRNLPGEPLSLFPIVMRDFFYFGLRRFVQTLRYGLQDHLEDHLPHMAMPTLIVRGSRDTVVSQRWVEEATRLLPDGKLVIIPHAAHDVNYNAPVQLTNVVHTFIQQQKPSAETSELAY